jgi:SAM-dependent methyltransferase
MKDVAFASIDHHNKKVVDATRLTPYTNMMDRWYESLEKDSKLPEYSVYSDAYYFVEVWLCWKMYSRNTLKACTTIDKTLGKSLFSDMENVKTVFDLGCGFGYTTVGIKQFFTNSRVIGTNFKESAQFKFAEKLGKQYNFEMMDTHVGTKADVIFASEYFEHIQEPIVHLKSILDECEPRYFITANAFGAKAIGHFLEYYHNNKLYTPKQISKMFGDTLRLYGFEKVKTSCWNNRPTYWRKKTSATLHSWC